MLQEVSDFQNVTIVFHHAVQRISIIQDLTMIFTKMNSSGVNPRIEILDMALCYISRSCIFAY